MLLSIEVVKCFLLACKTIQELRDVRGQHAQTGLDPGSNGDQHRKVIRLIFRAVIAAVPTALKVSGLAYYVIALGENLAKIST